MQQGQQHVSDQVSMTLIIQRGTKVTPGSPLGMAALFMRAWGTGGRTVKVTSSHGVMAYLQQGASRRGGGGKQRHVAQLTLQPLGCLTVPCSPGHV